VERLRKILSGLPTLPIPILGFILATAFFAAVTHAMWHRRVSRKCYLLLLDRTVGDILACAMAIVIGVYIASAKNAK
jgi:predicted outer membrane lipoprotein